jgi:hypothetical protein
MPKIDSFAALDLRNERMHGWSESRMRCRVLRSVQVAGQATESKDWHTCVPEPVEGNRKEVGMSVRQSILYERALRL